jgi:hypothetical protein
MRPAIQVLGAAQLRRNLLALGKTAQSIGRTALRKASKSLAVADQAAAPKGKTGSIPGEIGFRSLKRSEASGQLAAKAGLGVGKKKIVGRVVNPGRMLARQPHGHLIAAGTKNRYTGARTWRTKKGGMRKKKTGKPRAFRGRVQANPFIRQAAAAAAPSLHRLIGEELTKGINRAWARRNKKLSRY